MFDVHLREVPTAQTHFVGDLDVGNREWILIEKRCCIGIDGDGIPPKHELVRILKFSWTSGAVRHQNSSGVYDDEGRFDPRAEIGDALVESGSVPRPAILYCAHPVLEGDREAGSSMNLRDGHIDQTSAVQNIRRDIGFFEDFGLGQFRGSIVLVFQGIQPAACFFYGLCNAAHPEGLFAGGTGIFAHNGFRASGGATGRYASADQSRVRVRPLFWSGSPGNIGLEGDLLAWCEERRPTAHAFDTGLQHSGNVGAMDYPNGSGVIEGSHSASGAPKRPEE